jgi:hypothetical protein
MIMNWKGFGHSLIAVLYQHLPGRTKENHKNLRAARIPDNI